MRNVPERAGWMVVTLNYHRAVAGLVGAVIVGLLTAFTLVHRAVLHRPFEWFLVVMLVVAAVWAARLLGNVLWLRQNDDD